MYAVHLQTESLTEPLGLGASLPRFSWHCEDGTAQTAYRVVATSEGKTLWDSGKVASASRTWIRYGGEPLKSRQRVRWTVTLWDEEDLEGPSASSRFEMGLLGAQAWSAKWITSPEEQTNAVRSAVDCFRRTFTLKKEVAHARLYATARGLYDVTLNGTRIEDQLFAPGMTDYRKRIQSQTYDVAALLKQGGNTLDLRLADGWYRGSSAAFGVTHVYGDRTSVMAQLEVFYTDGTSYTLCTDKNWSWCNDGPLRFADLKDGEVADFTRTPSFSGKAAETTLPKKVKIHPSDNVPVREKERFSPVLLTNPDGSRVLDFGQNIAGYPEFTVKGERGQSFRIVCGEILDPVTGHVDLRGIQEVVPSKRYDQLAMNVKLMTGKILGEEDLTPKQEILFTCSGAEDHYKTSFAVFGFRYAEIVGDIPVDPSLFSSVAVYSDMEFTGTFSCSNEKVNRFFENIRWSVKGNFLDLPTDCPTRERLGWSGDGQIFLPSGTYIADGAAFYRKWLLDMEDAQYRDGIVPAVFPYQGMELMYRGSAQSVGWADAVYLLPYQYYLKYRDRELLERCYPMMKKYARFLTKHLGLKDRKAAKANPYNAFTYEKGTHLGEWLEPAEYQEHITASNRPDHPEEATAYLHYAMATMHTVAEILGHTEDLPLYEKYSEGSAKAYRHLFVETGTLDTDRQAKLVRPIALGLLDGEDLAYARRRLAEAAENANYHVGTGFLSTVFLLPVLCDAGYPETAYRILENEEYPGWLSEVNAGATTVWEDWEGKASRNHYSPGAVCQWLFEYCAGIRVSGENRFSVTPVPGGTLSCAEASYRSIYGTVTSRWEKDGDSTVFTVTVPAGCSADIRLPDGTSALVTAGTHSFKTVSTTHE